MLLIEVSVSVLGTVMCGLNYSPQHLHLCIETEMLSRAEQYNRMLLEGDPCHDCRHQSAVQPQPEFPANLMEIFLSENRRIAPKLLEVAEDTAAFRAHNL